MTSRERAVIHTDIDMLLEGAVEWRKRVDSYIRSDQAYERAVNEPRDARRWVAK